MMPVFEWAQLPTQVRGKNNVWKLILKLNLLL